MSVPQTMPRICTQTVSQSPIALQKLANNTGSLEMALNRPVRGPGWKDFIRTCRSGHRTLGTPGPLTHGSLQFARLSSPDFTSFDTQYGSQSTFPRCWSLQHDSVTSSRAPHPDSASLTKQRHLRPSVQSLRFGRSRQDSPQKALIDSASSWILIPVVPFLGRCIELSAGKTYHFRKSRPGCVKNDQNVGNKCPR
jgi:hypothetical protein